MLRLFALLIVSVFADGEEPMSAKLSQEAAGRMVRLALDCVHREYPNKIAHVMQGPGDALPPSKLTPVFYGCYDWHSAVHGHWLLTRLLRTFPDAPFAKEVEAALEKSFTAEGVAREVAYFAGEGRSSFERPYGLAWLLQLCAELREWDDPRAKRWLALLRPLEDVVADRFRAWLPKLAYPIRTGEHSQTAFALGLLLDWARIAEDAELEQMVTAKLLAFHGEDVGCPLRFEPSGQDFLSPCLAVADAMRRVLPPEVFAAWLGRFLPVIPHQESADWLPLGVVTDPGDGKLAHLDGLNLSRAWMLEGILAGLPEKDPRRPALRAAANAHERSGLASITGSHYEGGHWLGSFAAYLTTGRGLR